MRDMLVKLYELPAIEESRSAMRARGVEIRRPEPWERTLLLDWIADRFYPQWAAECEIAFATVPASGFIAIREATLIGFACHDCTRRNFFGPSGVAEAHRRQGVGAALLLACMYAMRDRGYAYAIIGAAGPEDFYARTVAAVPIPGSTPGIYDLRLLGRS
jgi:GNAT superfamily N-acetyltransferase